MMKFRILMLSLLGLIFFNSCSSDSNSSNSTSQNLDPNTLLPKQIMITEPLNDTFFQYNFFYNGNKIDYISYTGSFFDYQSGSIVSNSGNINFTYNGNLITKIDYGFQSYNFTYQNNKILTCNYIADFPENNFNINFQYGSNGSVIRTITYPNNPNFTTPLVESLNNSPDGLPYSISLDNKQSNIQYTGSNSVYKNILGFNEVLSNMFFCNLIGYFSGSSISPPFSFNSIVYFNGMNAYSSIPDFFLKLSPIHNYDYILNYNVNGSYNFSYSYTYNEINFPTSYQVIQSGALTGFKEYGTIIYY